VRRHFPENTHKTRKNTEIGLEIGIFRVEICSVHRNSLEGVLNEGFSPNSALSAATEPGQQDCNLWKGIETMADSREVMNIRQASQYLGVSPDTLYKYVGEQKIPAFKLGNRWRFKKSRLDQWMEEKSTQMEARGKKKTKAAVKAAGQI
jgi:excisionase family DNA binding protein